MLTCRSRNAVLQALHLYMPSLSEWVLISIGFQILGAVGIQLAFHNGGPAGYDYECSYAAIRKSLFVIQSGEVWISLVLQDSGTRGFAAIL